MLIHKKLALILASSAVSCYTATASGQLSSTDRCGPIGCLTGGASSGATAELQRAPAAAGGSPASIRTQSPDVPSVVPGPTGAPEAAAPSRHDFYDLVESSLGHSLPLFGRGLFENASGSFVPADHIGVPADYVIGPGDELVIRSWGKLDTDARVTVDRNGQIFLPVVGSINVAGVSYKQLQNVIETPMKRQYRDFQLSVTLGQLRSIQIFVLGRARRPGAYIVNSLSTLVDALFASGGPSATGTLRDIQVKRNGRVVTHLDIYDLLLRGEKGADIPLIAGDILFIPNVGTQVAIDGDVNTPGIYEVKPGTTTGDLVELAGGLTTVAGTRRSVLEHIVDRSSRRSDEFALEGAGLKLPLSDGDVLRIFPFSPKIENAVTLRGNVAEPGRHTWHPGMRVSDLVPSRESLLTRAYYNGQNSSGAVPQQGFVVDTRKNLVSVASHESEINWNYAVVERLDTSDLSTHLIPFALGQAIAQPGSTEDKELQAGDVINVYSRNDQSMPQQSQAKFVRIDGEVVAPGIYRLQDGETLRDLVKHAGGFTQHTYLYASELTRDSVRLEQEAKLRQIIAREQLEALSPSNQPRSSSESGKEVQGELALRQAYIAKLGDIHPTGRVVLGLDPTGSSIENVPAFALMDGDHFFLPAVPNTVSVLGNVYNEGTLRYMPDYDMHRYLLDAGGPARDADQKRTFILRANGTLVSRQAAHNFARLTIYPGDTVVVPAKLHSPASAFEVRDWLQVLSSFSITALAIKALQN